MNDLPERALAAMEKYGGWQGVLDALRDAERYRWLRRSVWYVGPDPDGDTEGVSLDDKNSDDLDSAIDAAMNGANTSSTPKTSRNR